MKKRESTVPVCLKLLYLCIGLSLTLWLFTLFTTQKYMVNNSLTAYTEEVFKADWVDDLGNTITVPGKYDVKAGEVFRIHCTFAKDMDIGNSILFRTDHTFVRAYLNGEEIYRFGTAEEIPFGKTPGSGWQLIELGKITVGDVLTIEQRCPYGKYSGLIREILIGTRAELLSKIMLQGLSALLMTVIPMLIGITIMILPPFFLREYSPLLFFDVGISFVLISVWCFTEARVWQVFFKNAYAMQMLNFVMFSLFVPCVILATYRMKLIQNKKLYRIMLSIDVSAALLLMGLQVFEIADYFESLWVVHVLIAVNAIVFITSFIRNNRIQKGLPFWMGAILYVIIGMCALFDLLDFYVWDYFGNGFFTRIVILMLLVCAGLTTMRRAMVVQKKKIEQQTYEKMAYTDNLTSLKNRRAFDEDIQRIEQERREITLLYLDMNGLKIINDNMGHYYGDEALKLISEAIYRFEDAKTTCYRLGGDEFCVLSANKSERELCETCEQINRELRVYEEKFGYPIGISYGVQKYQPDREMTMQQCMVAVDEAMYTYKQQVYAKLGKGR